MVSVGTIIWLSSELMFFAALFASYFTIRSVSPALWEQNTELLNVPFAAVNTTILVLSSVTCQLGVFAAERGQVGRTGAIFDPAAGACASGSCSPTSWARSSSRGQVTEYTSLVQEDVTISCLGLRLNVLPDHRVPRPARHRRSGRVPVGARPHLRRQQFTHEQAVGAIVVSYYWHFVDVVWIALFATIYLMR